MTTRNYNGRPIFYLQNIRERQQDIDLAAVPLPLGKVVARACPVQMPARMDIDELRRAAQRDETLVDEQPLLPAHIPLHVLDPAGMVDQLFEGFAPFDDVLQVPTVDFTVVGMALHTSPPLAILERWDGIDRGVNTRYLLRADGSFQGQVTTQVEEIVFSGGRHGIS